MGTNLNRRHYRRRKATRLLRAIQKMILEEGFNHFLCTAQQKGGTIFLDFTNMIAGGRKTFGKHVDSFLLAICAQFGLGYVQRRKSENSVTFALRRE